MSDVGSGLAYLCRSCCCFRDSEVSADGSHFRSRAKADPRERQIDEEFLARDYRRDASGRFKTQPTPTTEMFPKGPNETNSYLNSHLIVGGDVTAPKLMHADSASTNGTSVSDGNTKKGDSRTAQG
ncbi:hypothetical protein B0H34DRAFT_701899 [Crassisporium funariophilum]|nr:hypothetical protein B0H34DRAFT_701899 [Crassisporium funariophilum]